MNTDISSVVNLIKSLSQNSQDDTDPNNIVLQKFQSPNEQNQLGENVTVTKWGTSFAWVGGQSMTFSRASISSSPDGTTVLPDVPRFSTGKYGKQLLLEEATTNWILNSDFMTINTSPNPIFSDTLQNSNGQVWTYNDATDTFQFDINGATVLTGQDAILIAGSKNWRALTSSFGGWSVPLQFQTQITTGSTLQGNDGALYFLKDGSNWYRAVLANGIFYLEKSLYGTMTVLNQVAVPSEAVRTTYTINLSIDINGALSTQLYLGTSGGTKLADISATDNSIPQGFQFAVSGDVGVSMLNTAAWGPLPQYWSCNPNGAWSNVIATAPSLTGKGYNSLEMAHDLQDTSDTYASSPSANFGSSLANTTWTFSFTAMCSVAGPVPLSNVLGPRGGSGNFLTNAPSLLNFTQAGVPQTFTFTGTFPAGETSTNIQIYLRPPADAGITITYSSPQLENKAYATTHHRNDSTSMIVGRTVETLTIPTSNIFNKDEGTIEISLSPLELQNWNNLFSMTVSTGRFLLFFDTSGVVHWDYGTANSSILSKASTVAVGQNVSIAMTWSVTSGTRSLYINGQLIGTMAFTAPTLASIPTSFSLVGNYGAAIDDLRISNRARTASEVLAGYQALSPLSVDSNTTCKMNFDGDLSTVPFTTFNWNQGGKYL